MRFEIPISNSATGEYRSILVQLSTDEIAKADGNELYQHAYALRRAYREMPPGFADAPFFDETAGATRRVRAVLVN